MSTNSNSDNAKTGTDTNEVVLRWGKKWSETKFKDIESDYLTWMIGFDMTPARWKKLARRQLEQRGELYLLNQVELTPYSVDKASQRVLSYWMDETAGTGEIDDQFREPGFYSWLRDRAKQAIEIGERVDGDESVIESDRLVFIFALEGSRPKLKSVRTVEHHLKKREEDQEKYQNQAFSLDDDLPF